MNENKQNNSEIKQISDDVNKKTHRDALKWIIIGLVVFAIIILIFGAGMFVGGMKAKFSYRWAENYHKNFAGPSDGFLKDWRAFPPPGGFIEGHGTFGEVIKINDSDFVIKGQGDVEKLIIINQSTIIKRGMDTIKKEDLKIGDIVVVIGSPNGEGQIEAKLIRIFNEEGMKGPPTSLQPPPLF